MVLLVSWCWCVEQGGGGGDEVEERGLRPGLPFRHNTNTSTSILQDQRTEMVTLEAPFLPLGLNRKQLTRRSFEPYALQTTEARIQGSSPGSKEISLRRKPKAKLATVACVAADLGNDIFVG